MSKTRTTADPSRYSKNPWARLPKPPPGPHLGVLKVIVRPNASKPGVTLLVPLSVLKFAVVHLVPFSEEFGLDAATAAAGALADLIAGKQTPGFELEDIWRLTVLVTAAYSPDALPAALELVEKGHAVELWVIASSTDLWIEVRELLT